MVDDLIKFKGTLDDPDPIFTRKIVKKYFGWKTRENAVVLHYSAVDHFDLPRKIVKKYLMWKTRENAVVLDYLAVEHFDFTRKIFEFFWDEKIVKMLGFCTF